VKIVRARDGVVRSPPPPRGTESSNPSPSSGESVANSIWAKVALPMRLPSRLLGALLAGGHVRSPLEDWPPPLWPNHGRSVRGVFAQVQGSRCREGMGFSMSRWLQEPLKRSNHFDSARGQADAVRPGDFPERYPSDSRATGAAVLPGSVIPPRNGEQCRGDRYRRTGARLRICS
jgi:hypothetical protein